LTLWDKWKNLKVGGIPALVALSAAALIIVLGLLIFNISIPKISPRTIQEPHTPLTSGKIFDPTAKRDTSATTLFSNDSREEQKIPEPENSGPNEKLINNQPTNTPTVTPTQIAVNGEKETTAPTPSVQSSFSKPIEILTVSLNQLDPDIRANIESKFKRITINAGGITGITKKGNAQAIIELGSSGAVKSIDILGIEVEPKEKMAGVKANLEQIIRSMNFPSPTINGKPVNVKIGINFSKVAKFSGSIIWEI
jgi:hypothetical protein